MTADEPAAIDSCSGRELVCSEAAVLSLLSLFPRYRQAVTLALSCCQLTLAHKRNILRGQTSACISCQTPGDHPHDRRREQSR